MNKNLVLLLTTFLISSYLKAQQPNWDSLVKEAAKTEIYTPVNMLQPENVNSS